MLMTIILSFLSIYSKRPRYNVRKSCAEEQDATYESVISEADALHFFIACIDSGVVVTQRTKSWFVLTP